MSKEQRSRLAYEVMYNYKYMLETGYTFDEYAQTVASQIDKQREDSIRESKEE